MLWQGLKVWYDYFGLRLGKPSSGQKLDCAVDGTPSQNPTHTLTTWGSHVARLFEFHLVVKEEAAWRTDRRVIMLLSHTLTTRGSHVARLFEFHLVVKEETAWRTDAFTISPSLKRGDKNIWNYCPLKILPSMLNVKYLHLISKVDWLISEQTH